MGMTPTELRTAIEALRMSQSAVARCVGIDPRTLRRYLSGTLPVPKWVPLALNSLRKPQPRSRTGGTGSTVADEAKS